MIWTQYFLYILYKQISTDDIRTMKLTENHWNHDRPHLSSFFCLFYFVTQVAVWIHRQTTHVLIKMVKATTIILAHTVRRTRTAAIPSIRTKYLAIQIVNRKRINRGTAYRYSIPIQQLVTSLQFIQLHKISHNTHRIRHKFQTVSIHFKCHSHLVHRHPVHSKISSIRDQQRANQACSINFFITNKADDEMPAQHSIILGNNHRSLSFLAFVMFWLVSY